MTTDNYKNKAVTFLHLASSGNVQEAFSKYVDKNFKHHNPCFEGSADVLAAGMEANARQNPDQLFDVKRVIEEDDLVVVHSHVRMKPADRGIAVVHIFRFENGLIAELWDVGQPIPDESLNQYGMF